jgi:hypothetical protein
MKQVKFVIHFLISANTQEGFLNQILKTKYRSEMICLGIAKLSPKTITLLWSTKVVKQSKRVIKYLLAMVHTQISTFWFTTASVFTIISMTFLTFFCKQSLKNLPLSKWFAPKVTSTILSTRSTLESWEWPLNKTF